MKEIIKMHKTAITFRGKSTKLSRLTDDMVFKCRKQDEFRNCIKYHRKMFRRRTEIRNKSRDSVNIKTGKVNSEESVSELSLIHI